jgi:hypothetical protein
MKENELQFEVTAGNVLLRLEPYKPHTTGGMEAPTLKRKPYDTAVVVQMGDEDGIFPMCSSIHVGAKFIIPQTGKTQFDAPDGHTYIVVWHKDLKVKIKE